MQLVFRPLGLALALPDEEPLGKALLPEQASKTVLRLRLEANEERMLRRMLLLATGEELSELHAHALQQRLVRALELGRLVAYELHLERPIARAPLAVEKTTPIAAAAPKEEKSDEPSSWIEIELVDMEDGPVAGEAFELTLPDGTVFQGTTNSKGIAYIPSDDAGSCTFSFSKLDQNAWEEA
jgi:hypothetical protein